MIPVWLCAYWERASAKAVWFCVTESKVLVLFTSHCKLKYGCSCKLFPTSGRFISRDMLCLSSSFGLPMPESFRICGVPMDPAEIITSLEAVTLYRDPTRQPKSGPALYFYTAMFIPFINWESSTIRTSGSAWGKPLVLNSRVAYVWVITPRFGLLITELDRYAVAELLRLPLPTVDCSQPNSKPSIINIRIIDGRFTNPERISRIHVLIERELHRELSRSVQHTTVDTCCIPWQAG